MQIHNWVLQVVGSNPAAPTNKINGLDQFSALRPSRKYELGWASGQQKQK
jgi:hypothetical protein